MKNIFLVLCLTVGLFVQAQETPLHAQDDDKLRVAVFDPTSSGTVIDEGSKVAVRELVSSTFVNTGKYNIVERSLLEKVMKEQEFSNSGVVDDNQATEIGKLAGAHKVVLSVVTLVGGRNMLSIKVIDVKTATIDQQKTRLVQTNDLLDVVEPLTLELLGEKAAATVQNAAQPPASIENTTPTPEQPALPAVTNTDAVKYAVMMLYADGMKVSSNGRKLSRNEVKNLMANTNALNYYNSGLLKRRVGNILLWTGVGLTVIGGLATANSYSSYSYSYDPYAGGGSFTDEEEIPIGAFIVAGVGIGAGITGLILKSKGKKLVGQSVEMYNRGNHTSNVEFNIGLTRHGIGLVVNF
jgi:hypothetical protein